MFPISMIFTLSDTSGKWLSYFVTGKWSSLQEMFSQINQRAFSERAELESLFLCWTHAQISMPQESFTGLSKELDYNHRQVASVKQKDTTHGVTTGMVLITKDASAVIDTMVTATCKLQLGWPPGALFTPSFPSTPHNCPRWVLCLKFWEDFRQLPLVASEYNIQG